jgi:glycine C-acetyltransferase
VFQSGFTANAGTVSSILTKDDVIISDELNHASIIDGCRLSKAPIKVFPHKDVDAARKIIKDLPSGQKKLLIAPCLVHRSRSAVGVNMVLASGRRPGRR